MPPKKESKPKPKQKTARDGTPAAHEGDEASVMASPKKRARTDSLNKPIPPLPFGKYPSEHGLLLNTLINNAPLAHYANLQAVKLFNEATVCVLPDYIDTCRISTFSRQLYLCFGMHGLP